MKDLDERIEDTQVKILTCTLMYELWVQKTPHLQTKTTPAEEVEQYHTILRSGEEFPIKDREVRIEGSQDEIKTHNEGIIYEENKKGSYDS